ncbi:MAG: DUF6320 domain-containing protein, partial [Oscillospiraceae bacterium]
SEKRCPLCHTEVINPSKPEHRVREYPYPKRVETLSRQIDKRFLVWIAGMIMLIPTIVTLFCDLVSGGGISWSLYVAGSMAVLFTWIFVPMLFKKQIVWLNLLFDIIATAGYVGLICLLLKGDWFWSLGLPIILASGSIVLLLAVLFNYESTKGILIRAAFVLFGIGLLSFIIDLLVSLYIGNSIVPNWSGYVFTPCFILAIIALILRKRKNFKEEIRRRFYI